MRVKIYQPAKSVMQSGRAKNFWCVEPDLLTARLPENLMGWVSAGDTMGEMKNRLRFKTQDEALAFAQKQGWEVVVDSAHERRIPPRSYMDNFKSK